MSNTETNKSADLIVKILYVTVFIGVMLLAIAVTLTAIGQANVQQNGNVTQTVTVTNETASLNTTNVVNDTTDVWVNSSGNTLQGVGQPNWQLVSFTLIDTDDDSIINSSYYNIVNGVIRNSTETSYSQVAFTYTYTTGWALPKTLAYTSIPQTTSPVLTQVLNSSNGVAIGLGNFSVSADGVVTNLTSLASYNGALKVSYTYVQDVTNSTGVNSGITSIQSNTVGMVTNFFALMPTVGTIMGVVVLIAGIVILVLYVLKMKNSGSSELGYTG